MKNLILITIFSLISLLGISQTVENGFEAGNWLYYYNHCWGISPNDPNFGTKVTGNGFSGNMVCETENLGNNGGINVLISPWIEMNGTTEISFKTALTKNATVNASISLIKYPENTEININNWTYTNTSTIEKQYTFNNVNGVYKVKWVWYKNSEANSSRAQIDEIHIYGTNVSNPANNCNPITAPPPPPDADNDGVIDSQDDYPNDASRAYNNYYPASDTSTLAFEDLWPSYGDYDMNDLVIGYKFKIVTNANHYVTDVYNTLIVRANGAGFKNGFGYQFISSSNNIEPSNIQSVTGCDNIIWNTSSNGTEAQSTDIATFIIFDHSQISPNWNTIKNEPFISWKRFNIHIKFQPNTVTYQQLNISHWNPFLIINQNRGQEVHLPDHKPTIMADVTLFGTHDDNTNLSGNYYKSKTNLPWALDIYGKFDYPTEKSDISSAYLHFQEWVLSNGTSYQNWWLNTNNGYRNNSLIY